MKPDKKKIVFAGIILIIVAFIFIYATMIMGEPPSETEILEETLVPELKEEQKQYDSRLEAVDQLSEKKPLLPPGLYNEDLIDDDGQYDPYLEEKEKIVMMDSILAGGPDLEDYKYDQLDLVINDTVEKPISVKVPSVSIAPLGNGHSIFFINHAGINNNKMTGAPVHVSAEVNGDQMVRKDERLELRLTEPLIHEGDTLATNTLLYAFCSFQPNRLLLKVQKVGTTKFQLEAYDISDGQKGIYIENSFRSQAATEVIDDVIQDINISGVPQVSGLKGIFQRDNRSVKVKVLHQYQLYLKPVL